VLAALSGIGFQDAREGRMSLLRSSSLGLLPLRCFSFIYL
jgi:hypothetical protein